VKILVYDKNFFQLLTLAQTDPVKASLIFQAEDTQFDLAQQEFAADSQEIASGTVSIQDNTPPPNKLVAMVDSALGIPTAHAQLTVFDPTTWSLIWTNQATNIEHQLENTIRNTLLQILKNIFDCSDSAEGACMDSGEWRTEVRNELVHPARECLYTNSAKRHQ
jgi:hypothetical protein